MKESIPIIKRIPPILDNFISRGLSFCVIEREGPQKTLFLMAISAKQQQATIQNAKPTQ